MGRYEEAIIAYDQALNIKSDYAVVFYNKACCYALQNQIDLALDNLETAINLDAEKMKKAAIDNEDFDNLGENERFKNLIV